MYTSPPKSNYHNDKYVNKGINKVNFWISNNSADLAYEKTHFSTQSISLSLLFQNCPRNKVIFVLISIRVSNRKN